MMAEAMVSSNVLFSHLDVLHAEVGKISCLKRALEIAYAGKETSLQYMVSKIRKQIMLLHELLNKIESEFQHYVEITTSLNKVQGAAEKEKNEAEAFLEVLCQRNSSWKNSVLGETDKGDEWRPPKEAKRIGLLKKMGFVSMMLPVTAEDIEGVPGVLGETDKGDEWRPPKEAKRIGPLKKTGFVSTMLPVTAEDIEGVPRYIKGRITCDQINVVVENINKAVKTKYRIRNQALKTMTTSDRNLYYRYLKEETKDTEGCYFVVEDDIKLFTNLRMDKRFHQIIIILRHCQRVKEVRTSGIIRYVIC